MNTQFTGCGSLVVLVQNQLANSLYRCPAVSLSPVQFLNLKAHKLPERYCKLAADLETLRFTYAHAFRRFVSFQVAYRTVTFNKVPKHFCQATLTTLTTTTTATATAATTVTTATATRAATTGNKENQNNFSAHLAIKVVFPQQKVVPPSITLATGYWQINLRTKNY